MRPIVCATRGGEASRRTQERAIALARERGAHLIFFFVADTAFFHPTNQLLARTLVDEMERLGRNLLSIAQARAREQGVLAEMVVRRGSVRQALEDFIREVNASALVLGVPGAGTEQKAFVPGELLKFAQSLSASAGVEVIIVE